MSVSGGVGEWRSFVRCDLTGRRLRWKVRRGMSGKSLVADNVVILLRRLVVITIAVISTDFLSDDEQ